MTWLRTVASPMPASNIRMAGGTGCRCLSSIPTRSAMTHFSLQVVTKRRYFSRLSKNRKGRVAESLSMVLYLCMGAQQVHAYSATSTQKQRRPLLRDDTCQHDHLLRSCTPANLLSRRS